MATSKNSIFKKTISSEQELIDKGLTDYGVEKGKMDNLANKDAAAEGNGAAADKQDYLKPGSVGIQADAMSRLGLKAGKLSETNRSGGYNAYQSRLSAVKDQADKAKEQYQLGYDMAAARAEADKADTLADWYNAQNADHWKTEQWNYQKAADTKADKEKKKAEAEAEEAKRKAEDQQKAIDEWMADQSKKLDDWIASQEAAQQSSAASYSYPSGNYTSYESEPSDSSGSYVGTGNNSGNTAAPPPSSKTDTIKLQDQYIQEAANLYTVFNGKIPSNYLNELIARAKNAGLSNIDAIIKKSFS